MRIECLKDEYWYGGCVKSGTKMPLSSESKYTVDTRINRTPNQAMPFFVAGMVLSSDLVQDANIYLSLYQMALQELDTALPGENGGAALRQSFYRV